MRRFYWGIVSHFRVAQAYARIEMKLTGRAFTLTNVLFLCELMPTQMLGVCCTPNAFRSFCLIGNQIRLSLDWDVITSPSQMTSLLALSSSWSPGYQTHWLRSPLIKQKRNCLLRKEAEKVLPGGVSSWGSWNDGFHPVPLRLSPSVDSSSCMMLCGFHAAGRLSTTLHHWLAVSLLFTIEIHCFQLMICQQVSSR